MAASYAQTQIHPQKTLRPAVQVHSGSYSLQTESDWEVRDGTTLWLKLQLPTFLNEMDPAFRPQRLGWWPRQGLAVPVRAGSALLTQASDGTLQRSSTSLVVWGNLGNRSTVHPSFWWCAFVMFHTFIRILVGSGGCLSDRCFVKNELKWWEGGCDWKELQNLSVAQALRGHSVQPLQLDNKSGSTHYAQARMPPGI